MVFGLISLVEHASPLIVIAIILFVILLAFIGYKIYTKTASSPKAVAASA